MENLTNLGMTEIAIVAIMALLIIGFYLALGQNPKPYIRRKILLLKSNNNSTFYSLNDFISYYPNTL